MKVLISGVNGFVGGHAASVLKNDHKVIGITGNGIVDPDLEIETFRPDELDRINDDPDVVVMCHAAISSGNTNADTEKLSKANVLFTGELVKRFPRSYQIYTSTVSIYGNAVVPVSETSPVNPLTEYAVSKLWGERIVASAKSYGILRLSSVYGERMKENTILPRYVKQALTNKQIEVWGNGERKQNYFSVRDAVHYIEQMINIRPQGLYLGVSAKETSNLELATMIASLTNAAITFKSEDTTSSVTYNNEITRQVLQIETEVELPKELKAYIDWTKKQF